MLSQVLGLYVEEVWRKYDIDGNGVLDRCEAGQYIGEL